MLKIITMGNLSNNGLKSVISILGGISIGTPGMKYYTARYAIIDQFFEVLPFRTEPISEERMY